MYIHGMYCAHFKLIKFYQYAFIKCKTFVRLATIMGYEQGKALRWGIPKIRGLNFLM